MNRMIPSEARRLRAFTLIEVLAVIVIMTISAALALPALMKDNRDFSKTIYDVTGFIDMARSYAITNNTYVWVGFAEQKGLVGISLPGGWSRDNEVVMAAFASRDGTRLYADSYSMASGQQIDPAMLYQLGNLLRLKRCRLDTIDASLIKRPLIPESKFQIASRDFEYADDQKTPVSINYPLTGKSTYQFQKIIQFSPLGDATKINDVPRRAIEVGLCATGGPAKTPNRNAVAVQIVGIAGQIKTYRP
jgi:prepilin-type N-terminal cleavage/methylation domain-containing protein